MGNQIINTKHAMSHILTYAAVNTLWACLKGEGICQQSCFSQHPAVNKYNIKT